MREGRKLFIPEEGEKLQRGGGGGASWVHSRTKERKRGSISSMNELLLYAFSFIKSIASTGCIHNKIKKESGFNSILFMRSVPLLLESSPSCEAQ